MTRKPSRRSSIIEVGSGPSRVRIYTIRRKDGYSQFTLAWKEGGRRTTRSVSCAEEARIIAQQITVRLTNGLETGNEATRRDIELLRHCEHLAASFGVSLAAAMDEWKSARQVAGGLPIADAVRFYAANRPDSVEARTVPQVVREFLSLKQSSGVSRAYIRGSGFSLEKFAKQFPGSIAGITVREINAYLTGLTQMHAVSRNGIRSHLVTLFIFARKQGYLHPDRKTAAELSEAFRVPDSAIEIYTPEEMRRILELAGHRILPLVAIGAFSGIRSAEILRLNWSDIRWDRGLIEISASKAKTAARRLAILPPNLQAWLAPWRSATGRVVSISDYAGTLGDLGASAGITGGWRKNALRHSFISYRVAETGDVARTSLEAGNSPRMIFQHYREVVDPQSAADWFSIMPPPDWNPLRDVQPTVRERIARFS